MRVGLGYINRQVGLRTMDTTGIAGFETVVMMVEDGVCLCVTGVANHRAH